MPGDSLRPTRDQLAAARNQCLPDVIASNLRVLFVGINPSLYSAAVGHHFARPGNRFWPALYDGGFTPSLYAAAEDKSLVELGLGVTNLVARATARANELTDAELRKGLAALKRKVRKHGPRFVAFVGVTAYRTASGDQHAALGLQSETIAGAAAWILPNPSGLNAQYQKQDFARLFGELRRAAES